MRGILPGDRRNQRPLHNLREGRMNEQLPEATELAHYIMDHRAYHSDFVEACQL